MTETEALAAIAALCDEREQQAHIYEPLIHIETLRAILAEVTPTDGVTYYEYKDGAWISRDDVPRVVYALRNQDHTSDADWVLADRLEKEQ